MFVPPQDGQALRHGLLVATIVTLQFTTYSVICKAHITAPAFGNLPAIVANDIIGISPPVLEKDYLFTTCPGPP